jgi:hypothetical protein
MAHKNVVALTPELVQQFRDKKLMRELEEGIDIDLPPIGPRETYVTTLSKEESEIFVEVLNLKADLREFELDSHIKDLDNVSETVKELKDKLLSLSLDEAANMLNRGQVIIENKNKFTDTDLNEIYEVRHKLSYLESLFWYNVKQRLGKHHITHAIRANFAVVEVHG